MSLGKPVIKLHDMDDEMINYAIKHAEKALDQGTTEQLVANYMKQCFENNY